MDSLRIYESFKQRKAEEVVKVLFLLSWISECIRLIKWVRNKIKFQIQELLYEIALSKLNQNEWIIFFTSKKEFGNALAPIKEYMYMITKHSNAVWQSFFILSMITFPRWESPFISLIISINRTAYSSCLDSAMNEMIIYAN